MRQTIAAIGVMMTLCAGNAQAAAAVISNATHTQVRRARALLEDYMAGFEHADTAALERALRADAALEMVGTRTWFSGRVRCLRYLEHVVGSPGDWLMIPTLANGQPAAAAWYRDAGGRRQAFGVAVLTVTPAGISRITVFAGGPAQVAQFGLSPAD